jgi:hypothetical protein
VAAHREIFGVHPNRRCNLLFNSLSLGSTNVRRAVNVSGAKERAHIAKLRHPGSDTAVKSTNDLHITPVFQPARDRLNLDLALEIL